MGKASEGIRVFTGILILLYVIAIVNARATKDKQEEKAAFTCESYQGWMLGDVPNPDSHLNCSIYYTCVTAPAGQTRPSEARECPMGPNGLLFYDFRNCKCEEDIKVCFDKFLPDHEDDFFACAEVYKPEDYEDDDVTQTTDQSNPSSATI